MAEEIIQLKPTVVSGPALESIREIGREIGLLPRRAGRGVKEVDTQLKALGETLKTIGTGLRAAFPGFGAFSRGAAGVGLAANQIMRGLSDVAKSLTDLHHTSRELGMTTQEIRGFTEAAEKAGIAPESMIQGLKAFRQNTEDFALRIGSVREELMRVGAGPLLARINEATTQTEKLKLAFDMAEALGRDSAAAKRLFDMLGLGADKLRMSWQEFQAAKDRQPLISEKEMEDARRYNALMVDLDRAWQNFKQRQALSMFDKLEVDRQNIQSLIDKAREYSAIAPGPGTPGRENEPVAPGGGSAAGEALRRLGIPGFQAGGVMPNTGLALLHAGETVVPAGGDILHGSDDTLIKTTKEG